MNEAPEELKRVCQELADQDIWPPYRLNIDDGQGRQVAFDVTAEYKPKDIVISEGPIDVQIDWSYLA